MLILQVTERAMTRAASVAHEDLKRGLNTLATITSLAPFVGILGAVWAISFDTFKALGTEKSVGLAMVAEGLSRACVPTAIGLLVGLHSLWCYRYLRGRLEEFDREMADIAATVINQLARRFGRLRPAVAMDADGCSLPYLEAYCPDPVSDRRAARRCAVTAGALFLLAWALEAPAHATWLAGLPSVLVMFCCSCVPAYAVWVDLLHRTPRGVAVIAAVLCLGWCVAGLFFPSIRF